MSVFMLVNRPMYQRYLALHQLINDRQDFEAKHHYPPYSYRRTSINFPDIHGWTLMEYAAALGQLEDIQNLMRHARYYNQLDWHICARAMTTALMAGQLPVAEYFLQQDVDCSEIDLRSCLPGPTKQWFSTKIQNALHESFPAPSQTLTYPFCYNPFFPIPESTELNIDKVKVLKRAVEIGDTDFIHNAFDNLDRLSIQTLFKYSLSKKDYQSLITDAASNGQIGVIEAVQKHMAIEPEQKHAQNPLIAAIYYRQHAMIDFLLAQDIDINRTDRFKQSALFAAVIANDAVTLDKLLQQPSIDLQHKDINNRNILHHAHNPQLLDRLLATGKVDHFKDQCDIYGYTPLDLAVQQANDPVIQRLTYQDVLTVINEDPQYGRPYTDIKQRNIVDRMLYYLKTHYRDTTYFPSTGKCNGFAFMRFMYSAQYFNQAMTAMANWDGTETSLYKPISEDCPLSRYHYRLKDLFEQWTNDVIWFQHSESKHLTSRIQYDRQYQYATVKPTGHRPIHFALRELPWFDGRFKRTDEQLQEMLHYFMRMPNRMRLELHGGGHVTSGYKNDDGKLVYYDPNFSTVPVVPNDYRTVMQWIIDQKYTALNLDSDTIDSWLIFTYSADDIQPDFWQDFEIFDPKELPTSTETALHFQKASPSDFNHLHVAVITNSLASLQQLIEQGNSDINGRDFLGRTPLHIAASNNRYQMIRTIMQDPNLNQAIVEEVAQCRFVKINRNLLALLKPRNARVQELTNAIINKRNDRLHCLINQTSVNINKKDLDGNLPIVTAVEYGNTMAVRLLLAHGADITKADSNMRTALSQCMTLDFAKTSTVFNYLNDIDEEDDTGKRPIHHAMAAGNEEAVAYLLHNNCDVQARTITRQSVIDLACSQNGFDWSSKQGLCLKRVLAHYQFDCNNKIEKEQLIKLICKAVQSSDNQLWQTLLAKMSEDIKNTNRFQGQPLLIYTLLHAFDPEHKIPLLIQNGIDPDIRSSKSGNTPVMSLIKSNSPRHEQLIEVLLKEGADLSCQNHKGETAFDLAKKYGSANLMNLFKKYEQMPTANNQANLFVQHGLLGNKGSDQGKNEPQGRRKPENK